MTYDALVIAANADDAETQMGGTLAKLADRGQRILLVGPRAPCPSMWATRSLAATCRPRSVAPPAHGG